MKMKHLHWALAVGAALATQPALAGDSAWYAGVNVGQSSAEDACDDLTALGFTGSCNYEDTGFKVFGGYQFSKNFAVEFGWVDLGEVAASGTVLGFATNFAAEASGFGASIVGALPLSNSFSLFARAGGYYLDVEATASAAGVTVSADDSAFEFNLGLGAQFDFGKSFALRAEWERYFDVGGDNTGESDIDLLSVGALFRF
jgi:OOP family OmpA-OmpF porin